MTVLKWKWPEAGLIFLVACLVCLFVLQSEELIVIPFYVEINASDGTEQIIPWENEDGEVYVFLPAYADISKALFRMRTTDEVHIQSIRLADQTSCADFQLDVSYELTFSSWGKIQHRQIMFVQSANVPTMHIDTESGSMAYIHAQKGNEETGAIRIYTADGQLDYDGTLEEINGRGNSTWLYQEKKAYSIKLQTEVDVLGMGFAQKWIVLANGNDSSNMRNKLVNDFAEEIGLEFSPDSQWVDLYLNGEYVGLYLLSERNEIHRERVNISNESGVLLSMELEENLISQNYPYVKTVSGQTLRIHNPQNVDEKERQKIENIIQSVENAILSDNGTDGTTGKHWTELIDLDSWVKKYLIEEIFASNDACFLSQYFYFDIYKEKVYAGPVWDYDKAIGVHTNWQFVEPEAFYANRLYVDSKQQTPWFYHLCKKDEFKYRLAEVFVAKVLPKFDELIGWKIESYAEQLAYADRINRIRWDIDQELNADTEYMEGFLTIRRKFLENSWVSLAKYYCVLADEGNDYYAYFSVSPGKCLTSLSALPNNEYQTFLGWYYEGTDEPFDPTRPIYEDTAVYAKWEDTPYKRLEQVKKLLPAGVIAIMFLAILAADVRRMRKGG